MLIHGNREFIQVKSDLRVNQREDARVEGGGGVLSVNEFAE